MKFKRLWSSVFVILAIELDWHFLAKLDLFQNFILFYITFIEKYMAKSTYEDQTVIIHMWLANQNLEPFFVFAVLLAVLKFINIPSLTIIKKESLALHP